MEVARCCLVLSPPALPQGVCVEKVDFSVTIAGSAVEMDGDSGGGVSYCKSSLLVVL